MPVSGDFGELARIRRQVATLPADGRRRVIKACAEEGRLLVEQGFEAGRAPSGAPWAPVRRGGQPLRDTGRLLASLTPKVSSGGFVIETAVAYADVHQRGATISSKKKGRSLGTPKAGWFGVRVTIPARPFLPEDSLPGPWEVRLGEAASDAIQVLLR
jgi:phage gpG-like protein